MSTQNELKQAAARAAIGFVKNGEIIGVGTGSTVDYFIDELADLAPKVAGAVPTSERSAIRLAHNGIALVDLNDVESLSIYVDGADEIDQHLSMIKGGGGALTREKIVAAAAQTFVCIADASKKVDVLGGFPLPVEVIPLARTHVMRELTRHGTPKLRSDFITDNGNIIIDVHDLQVRDPLKLEQSIERIVGVVSCGLFAARGADVLLLATDAGVVEFRRPDKAAARTQCHPEL